MCEVSLGKTCVAVIGGIATALILIEARTPTDERTHNIRSRDYRVLARWPSNAPRYLPREVFNYCIDDLVREKSKTL